MQLNCTPDLTPRRMPDGENDVEESIDDSFLTADNINSLATDLYCLITAWSQLVYSSLQLFEK